MERGMELQSGRKDKEPISSAAQGGGAEKKEKSRRRKAESNPEIAKNENQEDADPHDLLEKSDGKQHVEDPNRGDAVKGPISAGADMEEKSQKGEEADNPESAKKGDQEEDDDHLDLHQKSEEIRPIENPNEGDDRDSKKPKMTRARSLSFGMSPESSPTPLSCRFPDSRVSHGNRFVELRDVPLEYDTEDALRRSVESNMSDMGRKNQNLPDKISTAMGRGVSMGFKVPGTSSNKPIFPGTSSKNPIWRGLPRDPVSRMTDFKILEALELYRRKDPNPLPANPDGLRNFASSYLNCNNANPSILHATIQKLYERHLAAVRIRIENLKKKTAAAVAGQSGSSVPASASSLSTTAAYDRESYMFSRHIWPDVTKNFADSHEFDEDYDTKILLFMVRYEKRKGHFPTASPSAMNDFARNWLFDVDPRQLKNRIDGLEMDHKLGRRLALKREGFTWGKLIWGPF